MQGIRKELWDEVWCQTKGGLRRVGLGWRGGGVLIADTEVSLLTAHGDTPGPQHHGELQSFCGSVVAPSPHNSITALGTLSQTTTPLLRKFSFSSGH